MGSQFRKDGLVHASLRDMGRIAYFSVLALFALLISSCAKSNGFKATDYNYKRVETPALNKNEQKPVQKGSVVRDSRRTRFTPTQADWQQNNVRLKATVEVDEKSWGEIEFVGVKKNSRVHLRPVDPAINEKLQAQLTCVSDEETCNEFFIDVFYRENDVYFHDQILAQPKHKPKAPPPAIGTGGNESSRSQTGQNRPIPPAGKTPQPSQQPVPAPKKDEPIIHDEVPGLVVEEDSGFVGTSDDEGKSLFSPFDTEPEVPPIPPEDVTPEKPSTPESTPSPQPTPQKDPQPTPQKDPQPAPRPAPNSPSAPSPRPNPNQNPIPFPVPVPNPEPVPKPNPRPSPAPQPDPQPQPNNTAPNGNGTANGEKKEQPQEPRASSPSIQGAAGKILEKYRTRDQAFGKPFQGRLQRGTNLFEMARLADFGFQVVKSNGVLDYFATFGLAETLAKVAEGLREILPNRTLYVTALSKWGGGYLSPHTSHQNGTDADIRYLREQDQSGSVVDSRGRLVSSFLPAHQWKLIKKAFETNNVELIFVGPSIKRAMCDEARRAGDYRTGDNESPGAQILKRLVIEAGHNDHFHLRVRCSDRGCSRVNYRFPSVGC